MDFIEKFNYNRDSVTTGSVLGFTGSPIYGASMDFEASNSSWRASSYNQFIMANGINSVKVNMELSFQGGKESMKSVLRRVESVTTGQITGNTAFSGIEDCINFGESKNNVQINLDTDYYKNFSGSHVEAYNIKNIGDSIYELNVKLSNNRVSPI